jgi:midasin
MVEHLIPDVGEYGGHDMRSRNDVSIMIESNYERTLSSLIRSAVSNNVNLPISDTIPSIFGLETATASVDCHLLDAVRRSVEVHWRVLREYDERAARIQQRAVFWYGRDMVDGGQWMDVNVLTANNQVVIKSRSISGMVLVPTGLVFSNKKSRAKTSSNATSSESTTYTRGISLDCKITMDCSAHIAMLLSKESQLPHELVDIIRNASNTTFLAAITSSALDPRHTDTLFTHLEPLFAEICARWNSSNDFAQIIPAFGRMLHFAPHLSEYAEAFLARRRASEQESWTSLGEDTLVELLLGVFRILVFDNKSFGKHIKISNIYPGLSHASRAVRYLTIRALCVYMHAADAAMEDMISIYLGSEAIYGLWEGKSIDYRFFSLWEERRWKDTRALQKELAKVVSVQKSSHSQRRTILQADLSESTVEIFGRLMPRLGGPPSTSSLARFVPTESTVENARAFSEGLLHTKPLLLTGLAGAGKTAVVNYCAQQLNKLETMVTLHLNEQSDAKMLIGMYTSGSTPGTFVWRAGALTTAVREGRWVFIEDLDRAPNEIISTLLPLIERGELLIPSRSETVQAARGFKIIATMRTNYDMHGNETMPRKHMIGSRFWRQIPIKMLDDDELREVVTQTFPQLQGHVSNIISVYGRLKWATKDPGFASAVKTGSARPLTPRDLLKWCHRMQSVFARSPVFSENLLDYMFLEAVDCFAGYLQGGKVFQRFVAYIAEELHIDGMRRDHLLKHREIRLMSSEKLKELSIGRVTLNQVTKQRTMRPQFATSSHTLRLIERLASAVENMEPMLLVGETGIGKTTCVQYLAERLGRKLVSFNLSQQSESGDLLGGFKPVNVRGLIMPLKEEFDGLFDHELSPFARKKEDNARFVSMLGKATAKGQWKKVCVMWKSATSEILKSIEQASSQATTASTKITHHPKKKQKVAAANGTTGNDTAGFYHARWKKFATDVDDLDNQLASKSDAFAFRFVEGSIVKAVRNGDWVLLDEINLATPDTLEALVDLLGGTLGTTPSLLLTEAGNIERVTAHPNFRVFAAMNPATDVGKKDLPPGIRSRFTELYVDSPDQDLKSLESIVQSYLDPNLGRQLVVDVTNLYQKIQECANENKLADGAGQKPHFSLRTLTRTLTYARDVAAPVMAKDGIYRRALYEGFHMSFLTLLDSASENLLTPLIKQYLFSKHANMKSEMSKALPKPIDGHTYVQERHYWLRKGPFEPEDQPHYIITPFVRRNLDNLIRAVSTRKLPILIQGPTSSGKTSMIEYLAKKSGNKFIRINNHEHTDLQEYLGTYMSGTNGKLYFQEGVLVEALKKGYWIVLDELNLAPTDVLEALNRLLDDNRELLIPETQEIVRPHPDFMLFATQNPAGLYGGRKHLSRAFRNRFLELHFDDIPVDELCDILHQRTQIPRSWAQRIVDTYRELSNLRQENRLFEQKSFATLRDLFRWALRKAETLDQLAINGYMLLAERVRKTEEREKVKSIIEDVLSRKGLRVRISDQSLYAPENSAEIIQYMNQRHSSGVVWTNSMRRLFCLVSHALRNNEPVLLIGETGCGKTTVCQMLADTFGKDLFIVNAHQNTETGDLIGSQRPIRNRAAIEAALGELQKPYEQLDPASVPDDVKKQMQDLQDKSKALFEWSDGALVSAMKTGQLFLLDEISLADDSVLERLNSVLESGRSLLLAEKGSVDSAVTAQDGFQFLATMNPGGDYGKKELSPALRNRFTEIWVPSLYDMEDILEIVRAKLTPATMPYADAIVRFSHWFNQTYNKSATSAISIRDTLGWIEFINKSQSAEPVFAIMHGAAMVYIDTLGANPAAMLSIASNTIDAERQKCVAKLGELLQKDIAAAYFVAPDLSVSKSEFGIGPFHLPRSMDAEIDPSFSFTAPTTRSNAMRIFRALQLIKPILIEGNPGVGKTTLVTAIARSLGKRLVRINLSEQTDLMDLFGSDVPVEGARVGSFAWRDAPFLSAMKNGDWVLLDEMNLASQSVLEGLNACLDHRAEAYIAELDQTFKRHPNFRLFAAQNPHHQGGGRKGLPASFVNRFSVVYADVFRQEDLLLICKQVFPDTPDEAIMTLTSFVDQLENDVAQSHRFGAQGSPWEFNLRDTLRWLQLLTNNQGLLSSGRPYDFCDIIFRQRFRNSSDRASFDSLYAAVFKQSPDQRSFYHNLAADTYQVGLGLTARNQVTLMAESTLPQLRVAHLPAIESLMLCTQQNWPVILVGPTGSGKTTVLEHLAAATGANLASFPMNADIDAMDLVGGYEQADPSRRKTAFLTQAKTYFQSKCISAILAGDHAYVSSALEDAALWNQDPSRDVLRKVQLLLSNQPAKQRSLESQLLYNTCMNLLEEPDQIKKAQFEWVDGLLVQSLERGDWLVLDNANLCSSSVLDRLNSLLEPNGYLSLNEHPMDNGQARIVKPHPNFRIFLTMDPRNGELSRAMRNRAIEIFFLSEDGADGSHEEDGMSFALESSMYRYRNLVGLDKEFVDGQVLRKVVEIAADHVSFQDLGLQERFREQVNQGLVHEASLRPAIEESLHILSTIDAAWVSRNLSSQRLIHLGLKGQIQVSHLTSQAHEGGNTDPVIWYIVNTSIEQQQSCSRT